MKHIVLVGNTSWGMYNFRKNLIINFLSYNYKVSVIAPYDNIFSDKLSNLGCNFYPIKLNQKGKNVFCDFIYFINLFFLYRKLNPSLIFHYTIKPNIYGSIAAKLTHTRSVAIITGLGSSHINNKFLKYLTFLLYKISLKFPTQIWFLNNYDKEVFLDKKIIQNKKHFVLKGEGINPNEYQPSLNHINNIEFIFVGRLLLDKGIYEYVEAAKIIKSLFPNTKFKILGFLGINNPTSVDPVYIYKNHNDGIIEYLGETEDVSKFISNSTCLILPSYSEGLSRVLLEAACLEKPIIASDIPGCNEIVIEEFNGLLIKPKSIESLVNAIIKFIYLPNETKISMGLNGREFVIANFNEDLVFKQYHNFINSQFV
jgi:glycosyltransferase involved in cell wall biosynthesis